MDADLREEPYSMRKERNEFSTRGTQWLSMGHNDHEGEYDEDDDIPDDPNDWKLVDLGEWTTWLSHRTKFGELVEKETPRGGAVLARAYLEDVLDTALLSAAINNPNERRQLTEIATRSFPQKIDAWAKFAKLPKRECMLMHRLKDVGDAFAHRPRAISFDEKEIAPLMRELALASVDRSDPSYPPSVLGLMTLRLSLDQCIANIVNPPKKEPMT